MSMKKKIAITTAALCAAVSMTVCADPAVSKIDHTDADAWVEGTNLLRVEDEDKEDYYALEDTDGNMRTDSLYSSSFTGECGFVEASLGQAADENDEQDGYNISGLLNSDGEIVIPFEYGKVDVLGEHWAAAEKYKKADYSNYDEAGDDEYYLIDTVDLYYLDGAQAEKAGTLSRDNYADAAAHGRYLSVEDRAASKCTLYDRTFTAVEKDLDNLYATGNTSTEDFETYYEDGFYGLKDSDGNILVKPSYDYISSFAGDYAEVTLDDKAGLINREGKLVLPAEFDSVELNYEGPARADGTIGVYDADGYFAIVQDKLFGFADSNGNVTAKPKYSQDFFTANGASATYTDMENKLHILAADGTDTVLEDKYDKISALEYCSGLLYVTKNDDGDYGLIDWHGNELLPCDYYGITASGDGNYLLVRNDYDDADIYTVTYGSADAGVDQNEAAAEAATE